MTVLATAAGLVCGVGGYWLGGHFSEGRSPTQLHVIEREADTPYSQPNSGQPPLSVEQTKQAATPAPAVQPAGATVSALIPAPVPVPVPIPVPVPVPVPVPSAVNNNRLAAQALTPLGPQPLRPKVVEAARVSVTPHSANKTADRPPEAVEVTLPVKPQVAEVRPTISPPPAVSKDYKVVNVIEGVVIVRQGQAVRPIKVGERMPDGQTLKSVNTDKGQFETQP